MRHHIHYLFQILRILKELKLTWCRIGRKVISLVLHCSTYFRQLTKCPSGKDDERSPLKLISVEKPSMVSIVYIFPQNILGILPLPKCITEGLVQAVPNNTQSWTLSMRKKTLCHPDAFFKPGSGTVALHVINYVFFKLISQSSDDRMGEGSRQVLNV